MAKGKRNLIIETPGFKGTAKELNSKLEKELKEQGVKYSDSVNMYLNTSENVVYCVVEDGKTIKVTL